MGKETAGRTVLSKVSIRWIAPVLFVLPVIAVTLALTIIAERQGEHASRDLVRQNIQQIQARITERMDYLLKAPPKMTAMFDDLFEEHLLAWDDLADARPAVFRMLKAFPEVSSVVLGGENKSSISIIRYPGENYYEMSLSSGLPDGERTYRLDDDGEVAGQQGAISTYDATQRPWYRAAVQADKPTWVPAYVWVRNGDPVTLGVSYVQPFHSRENGKLVGVIDAEMTLADMTRYMAAMEVSKTGVAYVVNSHGMLVAASNPAVKLYDGLKLIPASDANDPLIAQSAAYLLKDVQQHTVASGAHIEEFTLESGQRCQLAVSTYQHGDGLSWYVVTVVPDEDFLAHIRATRERAAMLGAAATALALAMGAMLALMLIRPVLQLSRQVREIGAGDLDHRVNVSAGREMTQLSSALNRMIDALKDRLRLRSSLDLAMQVQQSLLPQSTPDIQGVAIAAHSTYCDETGGDYYDFLDIAEIDPTHATVVVGDVMGHGVAAAMFMATARGVLRSRARVPGSLAELLTHVNELMVDDTRGERFMTMILLLLDGPNRTFRWAAAGHDPPMVYQPASDAFAEMADVGGLPLGIVHEETYGEADVPPLEPGTVILLGTDGLWEAQNQAGEQFGKDRLMQVVRETAARDAQGILDAILDAHRTYLGGRNHDDDVTFVVVKFD